MRQFLELIVENSFSGDRPLKEIVIGVRVFERAPDYDSNVEPGNIDIYTPVRTQISVPTEIGN